MGQNSHKLEIFRGLVKFKSNVQKIWGVLIFLSIVTIVEVALGIIKPEILMNTFLSMKLINWIFLILTIIKAYYITWDFMQRKMMCCLEQWIISELILENKLIILRKLESIWKLKDWRRGPYLILK